MSKDLELLKKSIANIKKVITHKPIKPVTPGNTAPVKKT